MNIICKLQIFIISGNRTFSHFPPSSNLTIYCCASMRKVNACYSVSSEKNYFPIRRCQRRLKNTLLTFDIHKIEKIRFISIFYPCDSSLISKRSVYAVSTYDLHSCRLLSGLNENINKLACRWIKQ